MISSIMQKDVSDADTAKLDGCSAGVSQTKDGRTRRGPVGASSRFRGVTRHRRTRRWEAHIWDNKKQVYLGGFDQEHHAAKAHDMMALKCRGQEFNVNFELSLYADLLPLLPKMTREDMVRLLRRQCKELGQGCSSPREGGDDRKRRQLQPAGPSGSSTGADSCSQLLDCVSRSVVGGTSAGLQAPILLNMERKLSDVSTSTGLAHAGAAAYGGDHRLATAALMAADDTEYAFPYSRSQSFSSRLHQSITAGGGCAPPAAGSRHRTRQRTAHDDQHRSQALQDACLVPDELQDVDGRSMHAYRRQQGFFDMTDAMPAHSVRPDPVLMQCIKDRIRQYGMQRRALHVHQQHHHYQRQQRAKQLQGIDTQQRDHHYSQWPLQPQDTDTQQRQEHEHQEWAQQPQNRDTQQRQQQRQQWTAPKGSCEQLDRGASVGSVHGNDPCQQQHVEAVGRRGQQHPQRRLDGLGSLPQQRPPRREAAGSYPQAQQRGLADDYQQAGEPPPCDDKQLFTEGPVGLSYQQLRQADTPQHYEQPQRQHSWAAADHQSERRSVLLRRYRQLIHSAAPGDAQQPAAPGDLALEQQHGQQVGQPPADQWQQQQQAVHGYDSEHEPAGFLQRQASMPATYDGRQPPVAAGHFALQRSVISHQQGQHQDEWSPFMVESRLQPDQPHNTNAGCLPLPQQQSQLGRFAAAMQQPLPQQQQGRMVESILYSPAAETTQEHSLHPRHDQEVQESEQRGAGMWQQQQQQQLQSAGLQQPHQQYLAAGAQQQSVRSTAQQHQQALQMQQQLQQCLYSAQHQEPNTEVHQHQHMHQHQHQHPHPAQSELSSGAQPLTLLNTPDPLCPLTPLKPLSIRLPQQPCVLPAPSYWEHLQQQPAPAHTLQRAASAPIQPVMANSPAVDSRGWHTAMHSNIPVTPPGTALPRSSSAAVSPFTQALLSQLQRDEPAVTLAKPWAQRAHSSRLTRMMNKQLRAAIELCMEPLEPQPQSLSHSLTSSGPSSSYLPLLTAPGDAGHAGHGEHAGMQPQACCGCAGFDSCSNCSATGVVLDMQGSRGSPQEHLLHAWSSPACDQHVTAGAEGFYQPVGSRAGLSGTHLHMSSEAAGISLHSGGSCNQGQLAHASVATAGAAACAGGHNACCQPEGPAAGCTRAVQMSAADAAAPCQHMHAACHCPAADPALPQPSPAGSGCASGSVMGHSTAQHGMGSPLGHSMAQHGIGSPLGHSMAQHGMGSPLGHSTTQHSMGSPLGHSMAQHGVGSPPGHSTGSLADLSMGSPPGHGMVSLAALSTGSHAVQSMGSPPGQSAASLVDGSLGGHSMLCSPLAASTPNSGAMMMDGVEQDIWEFEGATPDFAGIDHLFFA